MKEFKTYSTKEKMLVIGIYVATIIVGVATALGITLYINHLGSRNGEIEYRIVGEFKEIGNISEGDVIDESIYVENLNPAMPIFIRYYLDFNDALLGDGTVGDLLEINQGEEDPRVIKIGDYFYVRYVSGETNTQLFDTITWIRDQAIEGRTTMTINVQAVQANNQAVTNKWINTEAITEAQARQLNFIS